MERFKPLNPKPFEALDHKPCLEALSREVVKRHRSSVARYGWRWRTAFSEDFGLSLEVCNGFMKLIRALQGFMQV